MRATLLSLALCCVLPACGDNDDGAEPWILDTVAADDGFWIRTPEFPVASGAEIQDCYFFQVPDVANGADLWIDRTTLALNPGSHHMNVFRVKTIVNLDPANGTPIELGSVHGTVIHGADSLDCWKSPNWADWPLVANSQKSAPNEQTLDWPLPQGVAARFHPGEMLMLQVHYVNATDQPTPWVARAGINFYRSKDNDTMELGTLFATQQSIRVCQSDPKPRYSGACALPPGERTIVGANGHFHSRGTEFQMWTWDGVSVTKPDDAARFYDNTNWDEPKMETGLSLPLPATGGVWWQCDYQWTPPEAGCDAVNAADKQGANDCCYTFGPKVETSEHCNAFVYYYPKAEGDVSCF
ncbi:MAG: hypothetical protein ABI678_19820 [Kofleriaceae bacterium]